MKTLQQAIRPTTFIESEKLKQHLGLDITVASETFQHTGSFKFRPAYNLALNVPNSEILTASSGNFGQALAYACCLTGKKCTVVMPKTSAQIKIDAVRSYGATVDLIDTRSMGRNERVEQLAGGMMDAYKASAYDDQLVIEGNATLGIELGNRHFDAVIAPVGGGGLISGIAKGLRESGTKTQIFGAEPLMANDAARSLREGRVVRHEIEPMTIADGARTISVGSLNWPIIQQEVSKIFEVEEQEIVDAVRLYFSLVNLKCEPTGALSLAAVIKDSEKFLDRKICVVVSGGNVDPEVYRGILS